MPKLDLDIRKRPFVRSKSRKIGVVPKFLNINLLTIFIGWLREPRRSASSENTVLATELPYVSEPRNWRLPNTPSMNAPSVAKLVQ